MADISIIDTIGKTPLVRVNNVLTPEAKANDVRVLIKLEMQNPGGSIKDELSINYCDENKMSMVFTGNRHFKH